MNQIIYQELREITRNGAEFSEDALIATIKTILHLSGVSRREGLLSLEEKAESLDKDLKSMIMLIVDGTFPDLVEEISLIHYFANGAMNEEERLIYLMKLVGSLSIQQGENPRVIEAKLLSFLTNPMQDAYHNAIEEEERKERESRAQNGKSIEELEAEEIIEKMCSVDVELPAVDEWWFAVRLLGSVLTDLDDRAIQRILRDVENQDLSVAMKALSGNARRRIFSNLSPRLAVMIAEDMEYMGPVRFIDAAEACQKILFVIQKLVDNGLIAVEDSEIFTKLYVLVKFSKKEEEEKVDNELEQLFMEHRSNKYKRIQ